MPARRKPGHRAIAGIGLVAALLVAAGCGSSSSGRSATGPATTPGSSSTSTPPPTGPLQAPKTTAGQEAGFLTDVARADSVLGTYEQKQGPVALRALLTDGSAFCALLKRGDGLDNALVELAVGARSLESQTHLPLNVTTFNTVEAVALLRLCPAEEVLLPAAQRGRIQSLGAALGDSGG